MRIEEFHLHLPSKDLSGTLRFYTRKLLFTKHLDTPERCTVSLDRLRLSFVPATPTMAARKGSKEWLFGVQLDDVRDYYDRLQAAGGVQFAQALIQLENGAWQFSVIDNNGYIFGFSMPKRAG